MNKNFRENKPNKQNFDTIRARSIKNNNHIRNEKRSMLKRDERNIKHLDSREVVDIMNQIKMCILNHDIKNAVILMKSICSSGESGLDNLIELQLFQSVLSYLMNETVWSNILEILDYLSEIIDESLGSISKILNSDFSTLLNYLFYYHDFLKSAVFNMLSKISNRGEDACYFILEMDYLDLCKSTSPMDNYQDYIAHTLKNIFYYKTVGCQIISTDAIKMLKDFLMVSSDQCKSNIIWSFLYALEDNLINLGDVLDREIIDNFIKISNQRNEHITLPILKIFHYALEAVEFKLILLDNGIVECISNHQLEFLSSSFINYDCWRDRLFILSIIASGDNEDASRLRSPYVYNLLIHSLTNGTFRIQEEAVYFFRNIAKEETGDQIAFWIRSEVISSLCNLIQLKHIYLNCIILDTLICSLMYTNDVEQLEQIYAKCDVINNIERSEFHMVDCGFKLYNDLNSILAGNDPEVLDYEMIEDNNGNYTF